MNAIRKASSAAHAIGAIFLAFTFLSVVINVILRLFGTSLGSWVEEMSGYAVVWATYLGMSFTFSEGRHVTVDLLTERLPPKANAVVRIISDLLCIVFSVIIVWYSVYMVQIAFMSQRVTQLSGFPTYILIIVLPIGMALFTLQVIADAIEIVRGLLARAAAEEPKGTPEAPKDGEIAPMDFY
jgi:C4-dicarboxylate transporter, DctQ subunit